MQRKFNESLKYFQQKQIQPKMDSDSKTTEAEPKSSPKIFRNGGGRKSKSQTVPCISKKLFDEPVCVFYFISVCF